MTQSETTRDTAGSAPTITVLTPTRNRAHLLPRLYASLLAQTRDGDPFRDFEWLVVDDGSEDDTERVVQAWIDVGEIGVRYVKRPHGGKHATFNHGVRLARGAFTTCIDDDDWFVPDGLARLLDEWATIPGEQRAGFSGVVGLCAFDDGRLIGTPYPHDPLDCSPAELTYVHGVTGDKQSLLRTEVLQQFPLPFDDLSGEVILAIIWNRMSRGYRERHFNEVVAVKEYLEGGISHRAVELQIQAAPASRLFYLEEAQLPVHMPVRRRLRSYGNYVRFSLHAGTGLAEQAREAPSKLAWLTLLPVGWAFYRRDRRRCAATAPAAAPRGS